MPETAPERLGNRETLWNEVEQGEKRKDSQLSREVMVALPAELSHDQKEALAREYVQAEFVSQGMIADIGYHDFDSHNPHAHIMLTMRSVDEKGFGKKQRDWNKRAAIECHRQAWAEYTNRALERAGLEARIDHRSLKEQGIEREPQIHLGAQVMEMEAKGIQTRVGDESRRISQVNRDIERREVQGEKVRAEIVVEAESERLLGGAEVSDGGDRAAEPGLVSNIAPNHSLDNSQRETERLGGAVELQPGRDRLCRWMGSLKRSSAVSMPLNESGTKPNLPESKHQCCQLRSSQSRDRSNGIRIAIRGWSCKDIRV